MQKFKNVVNQCLVKAEPDELVGVKLPLPELHLLIGVSNHYYKLLLRVWPQLALFGRGKWTIHGRHGGGIDGANSVRSCSVQNYTEVHRSVLHCSALNYTVID